MATAQTSGSSGKPKKLSVQDRLKNLLDIESVQKIYVVDEQVLGDYAFENFSALVNVALSAGKVDELQQLEIEGHSFLEDIEITRSRIRSDWESWEASQHRNAISAVASLTNATIAADAQQAGKLNYLFGQNLVEYFHPDNWAAQKEAILSGLQAPQKIVVLFDEELGQADNRKGRDLIREIKNPNWQGKIVPILFTNLITTYQGELLKRDEIIGQMANGLSAQDFFALSKKRSDNVEDFADGIKKALLNGYCEQIKAASVAVLKKAFDDAIEEVNKLETYYFDDVVLRSSYTEGVWEALTFQRITQIFFEDGLHREITTQGYVNRVNKDIRASKKIRDAAEFEVSEAALHTNKLQLRHREIFLNGSTINSLNYPVESGDIFEIRNGKNPLLYILVGQECDLMIRTTGQRKLKIGTLLPITPKPETPDTPPDHQFELKYFIEGTAEGWFVKFNKPVFADMDFLDLTAFDNTGQAQLKLSEKELNGEAFSFAWENRYAKIWDSMKRKMEEAEKLLNLTASPKEVLSAKIYPAFSFPENILIPVFDGEKISLPFHRVKRLRAPHSKSLLEKYTRYQSRAADLHDFV